MNPYLSMAGLIVSMRDGIQRNLDRGPYPRSVDERHGLALVDVSVSILTTSPGRYANHVPTVCASPRQSIILRGQREEGRSTTVCGSRGRRCEVAVSGQRVTSRAMTGVQTGHGQADRRTNSSYLRRP